MDQQETIQTMLFLGYYNITQVEIFSSSVAEVVLLIGQNYINKAGMFTWAHH